MRTDWISVDWAVYGVVEGDDIVADCEAVSRRVFGRGR